MCELDKKIGDGEKKTKTKYFVEGGIKKDLNYRSKRMRWNLTGRNEEVIRVHRKNGRPN